LTSDLPRFWNYQEGQPGVNILSISSKRRTFNDAETLSPPNLDNVLDEILFECSNNKPDSLQANSNSTVLQYLNHDEKERLSSYPPPPRQIVFIEPCQAWLGDPETHDRYDTHYVSSPRLQCHDADPTNHPGDYEGQYVEQHEMMEGELEEQFEQEQEQ